MTAPFDTAAEKARDKNHERHYVAKRPHPVKTRRADGRRDRVPSAARSGRRARRARARRAGVIPAEQQAEQGQRQSMRDRESGKAERIHGPDGARPAQFVTKQLVRRASRADRGRRCRRGIATVEPGAPHQRRRAHNRPPVDRRPLRSPPICGERFLADRDGRTEARRQPARTSGRPARSAGNDNRSPRRRDCAQTPASRARARDRDR